jgi:acyl-[acyl-carrier-protein]-phospholipid O-acyltransferase/long-chain-fatty-acid--[acyl-carrier-protein] ligase
MRSFFFTLSKLLLKILFKVQVHGLENFQDCQSNKKLIISNHQSYLDAALIACFISKDLSFAVNTGVAELWWVKPFLKLITVFKLNPLEPMSTKSMIEHIKAGNNSVIFPEGRLTMTGSLMKVYNGPALIASASDATIIPVTLSGPERSFFSVLKGIMKLSLFPKINIYVHKPFKLGLDSQARSREKREILGHSLYETMSRVSFESINLETNLYQALLDSGNVNGINKIIAIDAEKKSLSFKKLINSSIILGSKLKQKLSNEDKIGLMIPNSLACLVGFWSIVKAEKTPVMLNFSMGFKALKECLEISKLKYIISSRKFIEQASLDETLAKLQENGVEFIYIEDLINQINLFDKVSTFFTDKFTNYTKVKADDTALILFTSGSEGSPKGVVLSHKNLIANCYQLKSCFDYNPQDILLNALPLFHSFGITGGMILPLLCGIKTLYYPSPLHYRIIPELAYQNDVTILYGTDSFLKSYALQGHSYDFYKLRYAIAGAEKLKDDTRKIWMDKFGVRILEAYGATEAAPGIAANTPLNNKVGSVGKLLPGIKYKLEDIPGISEGKKLLVQGPNLMKGYLLKDKPNILVKCGEWYDTGDIVSIDDNGFLHIVGRVKRFAKIAGEMISLSYIEAVLMTIYSDSHFAVINVPDDKKGERLILFTDKIGFNKNYLNESLKQAGLSELSVPKEVIHIERIPLLGSGKVDFNQLIQIYQKISI